MVEIKKGCTFVLLKQFKNKNKNKMKKLLFLFVALISLSASAQTTIDSTKTVTPKNFFVSVGVSTSQGDFETNSYPSVELGYTHESISYSAMIGRGDFNGIFKNGDNLDNYYYEFKFSPCYSVGPLNGFLIAGGGAYFNSDHYFAELGLGLSYTHKRFTYGTSFSNWDTKNYITPFISVSF